MTKMHHECSKYPKIQENDKNAPKTITTTQKLLKWPKYHWNLKNKQNTHKTTEKEKNTPKLCQNTLDFLDFRGIFVSFELCCSFLRILGHFAHFSNVEVYFLIILIFWGILVI